MSRKPTSPPPLKAKKNVSPLPTPKDLLHRVKHKIKSITARHPDPPVYATSATEGPFCDGLKRVKDGEEHLPRQLCKNAAGYKTNHPGQGRCRYHGGMAAAGSVTTGSKLGTSTRYGALKYTKVREEMDRLHQLEEDAMDLLPEVELVRAILIHFVNTYEEFEAALFAWYQAQDSKTKPRKVMDIGDAKDIAESISRIVERIHKIRATGSITLETFRRVTEQMGIIVAKHVRKSAVLQEIEREWGELALDPKAIYGGKELTHDAQDIDHNLEGLEEGDD